MNTPSEASPRPGLRELTPLEARVLGVLVEKQHTVPDTYPLSLNSLTAGCNQKTARARVMNVSWWASSIDFSSSRIFLTPARRSLRKVACRNPPGGSSTVTPPSTSLLPLSWWSEQVSFFTV